MLSTTRPNSVVRKAYRARLVEVRVHDVGDDRECLGVNGDHGPLRGRPERHVERPLVRRGVHAIGRTVSAEINIAKYSLGLDVEHGYRRTPFRREVHAAEGPVEI